VQLIFEDVVGSNLAIRQTCS